MEENSQTILEHRFKRTPGILSCKLDQALVLLDVSQGLYFSLDEVGAFVWELLENEQDLESLSGQVGQAFDAVPLTMRAELGAFVSDLAAQRLIQCCEGSLA